jgi:hypothetical protein
MSSHIKDQEVEDEKAQKTEEKKEDEAEINQERQVLNTADCSSAYLKALD